MSDIEADSQNPPTLSHRPAFHASPGPDHGEAGSSLATRREFQSRIADQSQISPAGSSPASKLIQKRSFSGSYLPPNISRAIDLFYCFFPLVSALIIFSFTL